MRNRQQVMLSVGKCTVELIYTKVSLISHWELSNHFNQRTTVFSFISGFLSSKSHLLLAILVLLALSLLTNFVFCLQFVRIYQHGNKYFLPQRSTKPAGMNSVLSAGILCDLTPEVIAEKVHRQQTWLTSTGVDVRPPSCSTLPDSTIKNSHSCQFGRSLRANSSRLSYCSPSIARLPGAQPDLPWNSYGVHGVPTESEVISQQTIGERNCGDYNHCTTNTRFLMPIIFMIFRNKYFLPQRSTKPAGMNSVLSAGILCDLTPEVIAEKVHRQQTWLTSTGVDVRPPSCSTLPDSTIKNSHSCQFGRSLRANSSRLSYCSPSIARLPGAQPDLPWNSYGVHGVPTESEVISQQPYCKEKSKGGRGRDFVLAYHNHSEVPMPPEAHSDNLNSN
ncbi:hypothetical protein T265_09020 [Opisthorchis viverrini]|uniref:Uncharacterized protein n=1 Tax=Opisthorchis viverrini TaxID=6198 RepID=A0A074Z747_OPIVI|nr:hypothetical protein T265_09020 [Opisthorchis viverrini]KER23011.1 hypothetical protein T265_09020 [Opisthorchis viverrini]